MDGMGEEGGATSKCVLSGAPHKYGGRRASA